ncbi:DUF3626 domain-containing protein [Clostridium sp.]|uniref:DUF3626 domain-containing protein n=1 Tax=Clostridium sp. TaxID=1506 RepID=UPI001A615324|nr:DUF3626 domain-containing protein [Clostridium sp.]MBK5234033.1 DUF3626 domain-containing protein [Clostridium sp.]
MTDLKFAKAEMAREAITAVQQNEIRDLYTDLHKTMANKIFKIDETKNISSLMKKTYLRDFEDVLKSEIKKMDIKVESIISGSVKEMCDEVDLDAMKLLSPAGVKAAMATATSSINTDAIETIMSGQLYGKDWSLTKSIWTGSQKTQKDIQSVVAKGILEQKSTLDIAKDLEKYVDPSAAKPWDWGKVYPGTNKTVDYNAQRLARTMVNHAYQESFQRAAEKNPFADGIRWLTTNSHAGACEICAGRASADQFLLGAGVFPANEVPLDHPNGKCTFSAVIHKSLEDVAKEVKQWGEDPFGMNPPLDDYAASLGFDLRKLKPLMDKAAKAAEAAASKTSIWDKAVAKSLESVDDVDNIAKAATKKVKVPKWTKDQEKLFGKTALKPGDIISYDDWHALSSVDDNSLFCKRWVEHNKYLSGKGKPRLAIRDFFDDHYAKIKYTTMDADDAAKLGAKMASDAADKAIMSKAIPIAGYTDDYVDDALAKLVTRPTKTVKIPKWTAEQKELFTGSSLKPGDTVTYDLWERLSTSKAYSKFNKDYLDYAKSRMSAGKDFLSTDGYFKKMYGKIKYESVVVDKITGKAAVASLDDIATGAVKTYKLRTPTWSKAQEKMFTGTKFKPGEYVTYDEWMAVVSREDDKLVHALWETANKKLIAKGKPSTTFGQYFAKNYSEVKVKITTVKDLRGAISHGIDDITQVPQNLEGMFGKIKQALAKAQDDLLKGAGGQRRLTESLEKTQGSVQKAFDKVEDFWKHKIDESDVGVRITNTNFKSVLRDGRFKNQYESGSSKGMFDPTYRKQAENAMFKTSSLDNKQRAIYGTIFDDENALDKIATQYGDIVVKLKKENVINRSTFTAMDSLNDNRQSASLLTNPKFSGDGKMREVLTNKASLGKDVKLTDIYTYGGEYPEVQIYNGVSVGDIKEVIFSNPDDMRGLAAQLDDLGIAYRTKY